MKHHVSTPTGNTSNAGHIGDDLLQLMTVKRDK